jgi:hypothetical protein
MPKLRELLSGAKEIRLIRGMTFQKFEKPPMIEIIHKNHNKKDHDENRESSEYLRNKEKSCGWCNYQTRDSKP